MPSASAQQWRSEGVGRPGAKCTNGAPPLAFGRGGGGGGGPPCVWRNIRAGGGGGSPLRLAKYTSGGGGGGEAPCCLISCSKIQLQLYENNNFINSMYGLAVSNQ